MRFAVVHAVVVKSLVVAYLTVLVGSDNDEYLPEGIAAAYGAPLKMATTIFEGAGHINTEAGFGEWPNVLDWCGRDNLAFF